VRIHAPDGSVVLIGTTDMHWPPPSDHVANTYIELPVAFESSQPGDDWARPPGGQR
jgi:hypothetical protein